jgi:F-type H+-transporting ATPase subunit b
LCASLAVAAEHAEAEGGDNTLFWKWINFGMLAAGLGYLIAKSAPPFLRARSAEIRRGIDESTELLRKAEAKAAEIDSRMARLGLEIDSLRATARTEVAAEGERVKRDTAQVVEKIMKHAEQEIASAAKAARQELKSYSARLAIELAAERARARLTPSGHDALVEGFVAGLARSKN